MKMKSLLIGISFVVGCCIGISRVEAAGAARGAKSMTNVSYTTTVSTIAVGPVALYSAILSSGAVFTPEFIALYDTAPLTAQFIGPGTTAASSNFRFRLFYSSTTANAVYNFDPPLQFGNGLIVAPSATTGAAVFVFEKGRVTQGY